MVLTMSGEVEVAEVVVAMAVEAVAGWSESAGNGTFVKGGECRKRDCREGWRV